MAMPAAHRITVRDAQENDVSLIVAFNNKLALETEGRLLDERTLSAGVRRGLAHPELCRYFIAQVDGEVAGTTMVTYELTDWRDGVLWWLQSVYIEPAYRRLGVFRAIYRHVESLARTLPDVRGVRLYVHRENARAMKTYEAVGMSRADYEVFENDWSGSVRLARHD
jgi:GNAT superfamily N-acetyltransferase